jgi:hypothetical protein
MRMRRRMRRRLRLRFLLRVWMMGLGMGKVGRMLGLGVG